MDAAAKFRIERDSMGEVRVPAERLYGAQTQRALENFPISGIRFSREFIRALGEIKLAAARTNVELGLLPADIGQGISVAAQEVANGELDDEFVLDIFQTGSGTSSNMNANEVIANRANQILGGGGGQRIHPNDHVNMCQSSNDVIPTAIHVSAAESIQGALTPAMRLLQETLAAKAREFNDVVKIGRTHLQDATPVRLGQEFGGYSAQIQKGLLRLEQTLGALTELPLGGTAVGTGVNADPKFASRAIAHLSKIAGIEFREAGNHFEAQAAKDAVVQASGVLKTIAVSLTKIANDIRWLASGPRCGLGEIALPETQPGSSIMPGKVNPVIAESVLMVAARVMGNDTTIAFAGQAGNFELNVMMPVMAHTVLESIRLLAASIRNLSDRCVSGIQANRERCFDMVEKSLALAAALAPEIGYDKAAEIAKEASKTGRTIRELVTEKKILPPEKIAEILDPRRMTEPGIAAKGE